MAFAFTSVTRGGDGPVLCFARLGRRSLRLINQILNSPASPNRVRHILDTHESRIAVA
jgi:hypothetical protein